jgi:hypothetical protein
MAHLRGGYLTIYSPNRTEVYGEFADGTWEVDRSEARVNHVFSGTAGDGVFETFVRLNEEGISHVQFTFDCEGERYTGQAQLLAPEENLNPGRAAIRIETGTEPAKAMVEA